VTVFWVFITKSRILPDGSNDEGPGQRLLAVAAIGRYARLRPETSGTFRSGTLPERLPEVLASTGYVAHMKLSPQRS